MPATTEYNWPPPAERTHISVCLYNLDKRIGHDVGYKREMHSTDGEGRVGATGFDKTLSFEWMISMARQIDANIIIKAGKNAKWYLKKFPIDTIDMEIAKQAKWRDTSRYTMWIINWDIETTKKKALISNEIPTDDTVFVVNKQPVQTDLWYKEESIQWRLLSVPLLGEVLDMCQ